MYKPEFRLSAVLIEAVIADAEKQWPKEGESSFNVFIGMARVAVRHFPGIALDFTRLTGLPEEKLIEWVNLRGGLVHTDPAIVKAYAETLLKAFKTQLEHYKR